MELFETVDVDFDAGGLGIDAAAIAQVGEVYNVAGGYRFSMSVAEARATNVDSARRIVEFTATLAAPVRLVHLSGYRVGGQDPDSAPWSDRRRVVWSYSAKRAARDGKTLTLQENRAKDVIAGEVKLMRMCSGRSSVLPIAKPGLS